MKTWSEQAMEDRAEQEATLERHRNAGSPTHHREALARWEGERYQQAAQSRGGQER